jgi:hypothetical protein
MTKKKVKVRYRTFWHERERGWGGEDYHRDFDTYKQAKKAIEESNARNQAEWNSTHIVPDYYVQCEDRIEAVEV